MRLHKYNPQPPPAPLSAALSNPWLSTKEAKISFSRRKLFPFRAQWKAIDQNAQQKSVSVCVCANVFICVAEVLGQKSLHARAGSAIRR